MVRLTPEQIQNKVNFVRDYIKASNAANGSTLDANANVSNRKNSKEIWTRASR